MTKQITWVGEPPTRCDVTTQLITNEFIDGRLKHTGVWGCFHPNTYDRLGCGLGTGKGQRYKLQDDGRWLKVEG